MTVRDFSVMPVKVVGQERISLARPVRRLGPSLQPGELVEVEFGVTWATVAGKTKRIDGTWHQCRIVKTEGADLHVELLGPLRTTLEHE